MTKPSDEFVRPILLADDDDDDRFLASEAIEASKLRNPVVMVNDGAYLLEALRGEGAYAGNPIDPVLVLLDLNMPRIDGREALKLIKTDPKLAHIPVVIMTTSKSEEDMLRATDLGASAFITKPVSFSGLVEVMQHLPQYWMEIVEVPQ
jgi:two-component system, response regulator